MLRIYEQGEPGYEDTLASLSRRGDEDLARVEPEVRAILDAVRDRGDEAVLEYTERFDGRRPQSLVLDSRRLEGGGAHGRSCGPSRRSKRRASGFVAITSTSETRASATRKVASSSVSVSDRLPRPRCTRPAARLATRPPC